MIAIEQALSRELLAVSKSSATKELVLEIAGNWLVVPPDDSRVEDNRDL